MRFRSILYFVATHLDRVEHPLLGGWRHIQVLRLIQAGLRPAPPFGIRRAEIQRVEIVRRIRHDLRRIFPILELPPEAGKAEIIVGRAIGRVQHHAKRRVLARVLRRDDVKAIVVLLRDSGFLVRRLAPLSARALRIAPRLARPMGISLNGTAIVRLRGRIGRVQRWRPIVRTR